VWTQGRCATSPIDVEAHHLQLRASLGEAAPSAPRTRMCLCDD
jgi:hypothetical protein